MPFLFCSLIVKTGKKELLVYEPVNQARAQTFWGAGAQTKKKGTHRKMIYEIKNNNNK